MKPGLFFTLACLLLSQLALASVRKDIKTSRFDLAWAEVQDQVKKYGASQVLLVVDLDNTILRSKQLLGSYGWFKWQEKMLSDPKVPQEGRVADSLEELFYINGLFYSYGSMELSEPDLPTRLMELQKQGVRILCLTSRGPAYWEATIRDLQKNGLSFAHPFWSIPELAYAKDFFPGSVLKSRFQLRDVDIARHGLSRQAETMLREGVMFSSGLHKGTMIDLLLKLKGVKPKALVFVDDSEGNIASLRDIYGEHELEASLFRYTRYDDEVMNFAVHSKPQAMKLWAEWQAILTSQDPQKLQQFIARNFQ